MARYVDAEKVEQALSDLYSSLIGSRDHAAVLMLQSVSVTRNLVENIPAADVEPVRHGKYTSTGHDEVYCDFGVCSLCGHWMVAGSNYCPNCGAKMDGEVGSDG